MAESGPAELRIRFPDQEKLLNFIRLLREEHPTQVQPFGADVNAVVYDAAEDESPVDWVNQVILVPGHREELESQFLLPKPGEEEPPPPPRRPRGVPDQPFATHGGPGGMRPDDGRTRGLNEPAPY
jgi:hypothetical protein